MSNTALTLVWETSKQDGSRLLILLAVADSINRETGSTFLSLDYLAQKARVSRRTLLDQLGPLEESSELHIAHGSGPRGCNVYSLGTFYQWGANFALPSSAVDEGKAVPPASGGRAKLARGQSDYAVSHPYHIEPDPLPPGPEEEVLTGTGAKSAPHSAPSKDQTPWVQALAILRNETGRAVFDTWIRDTELVSLTASECVIGCKNEYGAEWLRGHEGLRVKDALREALGRDVSVRFVVASKEAA